MIHDGSCWSLPCPRARQVSAFKSGGSCKDLARLLFAMDKLGNVRGFNKLLIELLASKLAQRRNQLRVGGSLHLRVPLVGSSRTAQPCLRQGSFASHLGANQPK